MKTKKEKLKYIKRGKHPSSKEMTNGERNNGSSDEKITMPSFKVVTKTLFLCTEKLRLLVKSGTMVNSDKIAL